MQSKFIRKRDELPASLQMSIFSLESLTGLRFLYAQDWTSKNQGWVLQFDTEIYKNEEQNMDDVESIIHREFAKYPPTYEGRSDDSFFEELEYSSEGWRIYLSGNLS